MPDKVWVVSVWSLIAGIYSNREKAEKRAVEIGDAEIREYEIDKDVDIKILKKDEKVSKRKRKKIEEILETKLPRIDFEEIDKAFAEIEETFEETDE